MSVDEPWAEPVPIGGAWESVSDDATGTYTATGPEAYAEQRPYSEVERRTRAAQIYAARLKSGQAATDEVVASITAQVAQAVADIDAAQSAADAAAAEAEAAEAAAVAAQGTADQGVLDAQAAKDVADAAAANALQALSDADDAMSRATTADGRVTVAFAVPTLADGSGKPVGALWYTRSGTGYASIWEWGGTSWEQTTIGTGGISAGAITEAKIATGAISDGKLAQAVKDSISGAASAAALAQQTAGSAQSAAAAAASAAAAAQGDADAAQAAADDAAADLLALSGRTGRVIRATSAPTTGTDRSSNNLWLNTGTGQLHEWNGSTWAVITDSRLTAAAGAADQAANLANAAQDQADTAVSLANAAQDQADTATSAASAAQAAATAAQSTASSAQSAASAAAADAAAAQGDADQAVADAANARSRADTALDLGLFADTRSVNEPPSHYWTNYPRRTRYEFKSATVLGLTSGGAGHTYGRLITTVIWVDSSGGPIVQQFIGGNGKVWTRQSSGLGEAAVWGSWVDFAGEAQATANQAVADAALAKSTADQAVANALAAQNAADTADGKATTASGKFTVATANPTTGDASGKPIGAVWEVTSGSTVLRRYVLTGATTWTQVKIGQDFIGTDAIGQAQISNAAVGTAEIADLAVTNAKIGSLAVGEANIASAAVTTAKIADLAVTTAKIADLAVETAKIKDGAIVTAKIGDAQITTAKIANLAVDNAKIADLAVTNGKIANLAVGTAQIADLAVTNGKIGDLSVGKLTATGSATFPSAVIDTLVGDDAFLDRLVAEQVIVKGRANQVDAVLIADGAVTAPKISTGALNFKSATGMELTAATLNGATVNGGHIYAPSATALPRVHIGDSTVEVIRGDEGQEFRTVSIGGSVADELRLYDLDGAPIFGVTSQGQGSIRGDMAVGGRITADGRDILSAIDAQPRGLIGVWYGPGGSSWPPIGYTHLGLGLVPIEAEQYRRYTADFVGRFTPQQAGDALELALRVRTESSNGYVTDTAIWSNRVTLTAGENLVTIPPIQYYAGTTAWTTFTVTARNFTTSTRSITLTPDSARIHVRDEGTGALYWGRASTAGGTPFSGSQVEETPAATTYTRRYPAVALRSWRGGTQVTDALHHGYWGGFQRYSWIGFDHAKIAADLSGASNVSARLTMRNVHTWNGRSTSVRIGYSAQTTAPASPLTSGSNASTVAWQDGALSTVSIPWAAAARSVVLGDGAGTSSAFYSKFSYSLADIALQLTFTKTGAA